MNQVACEICGKLGEGAGWYANRRSSEHPRYSSYYDYADLEPGWTIARPMTMQARPRCPEHQEAKP